MKYPTLLNDNDWSLFRDFDRLNESMNRFFDTRPGSTGETYRLSRSSSFQPACDIEEADGHYLMHFDLPGLRKEDVSIDIEGNVLRVSGERHRESQSQEGKSQRIERSYGRFTRSFTLPQDVEQDQVEATFENGVLSLAVPKAKVAQARKIEISEGKKDSLLERVFGSKSHIKAAK